MRSFSEHLRLTAGMLGFGFMVAASAGAQTVAVTNGDFESPTVSPGGFTLAAPPGWTLVTGGATDLGVFHPTVASWNYVAPSGQQLLYLNGSSVEQGLATNAAAGQTYLLAVDVVRRPGFWNPNYRIDFFAGTVLLGTDFASLVPEIGASKVSLIQYTVGPADPAIGQALRIRLGGPTQTNFDNVRVYVPEPESSAGLVGLVGLAGFARRRRARREWGLR